MTIVETGNLRYPRVIPIEQFEICLVDGVAKKDIIKLYPTRSGGAYYLDKFANYLRDKHNLSIKEYCIKYGGIDWPRCPGTGKEVAYKTSSGLGLVLNQFRRGGVRKDTCKKFEDGCKVLSEQRKGDKNPCWKKEPWNKGLDASDPRIATALAAAHAAPMTPERREKLRKAGLGKVRHAMPHTKEAKEKMRIATAKRWALGRFACSRTSIQQKMMEFLQSLNLSEMFLEELQVDFYSLDFAFKNAKVAIECDGDYFHINPKFYPNGPKDAIQRRNAGRDRAKNKYLENLGWTVLRYWECEINAGTFKEHLTCKLRELGLLNR